MTQFTDLGLAKPILKALTDKGYTQPTPIQAQAIPIVLKGRDLLGIAQTGTGKTAAFALPILHRLAEDRRPAPRRGFRCLVLSPTRELATQIAENFKAYAAHLGLSVATVYGGVKYGPQMRALAGGVDVLVATPGRLMDHLGEKSATLGGVEIFVLDEADQMLDLGFVVPIRKIASQLPKDRQNLFFSATMPGEIGKLAGELLKNPAQVSITPQATTVERIEQSLIYVEAQRKRPLLAELLADRSVERAIVFTRTKRGADRVAKYLTAAGIESASIHGDKTQGQRERALAAFKAGEVKALVATDIAARGIDVNDISHVFNYELPNVPEAYVHRIGRTARKGKDGVAISFCSDDERSLLKDIEKATRQKIPSFDRRNDKALAAAAAVADKLAPAEKYVDPRKADPRNNVPSELRRKRNRNGGGQGKNAQGKGGQGGGQQAQGRGEGRNGGRGKGGGQGQGKAAAGGGDFRGPKRGVQQVETRWSPID
ncbi:DEAD/DEAH box helicase [Caulobacter endophyticus]|uniref:DEAD/DEAH box helicase n=1 Tax=Caulobacter endophyticus TaxID=2172652 RepID=UPI00240FFC03|nr:DEAD/DEAH box helicase [Caulobacter endophyticus]MDG2527655.1 DEAD/DEAH box helicase [Caulobacter endophyticus]